MPRSAKKSKVASAAASASFVSGRPPLPSELIGRIAAELLFGSSRQTVVALLSLSKETYVTVSPILYRRIQITDASLRSLVFGLDQESKEGLQFEITRPTPSERVSFRFKEEHMRKKYLLGMVEEIVLRPSKEEEETGDGFQWISLRARGTRPERERFERQAKNRRWLLKGITGGSPLFHRLRRVDAGWLFRLSIERLTAPDTPNVTATFHPHGVLLSAIRALLDILAQFSLTIHFKPPRRHQANRQRAFGPYSRSGDTIYASLLIISEDVDHLVHVITASNRPVKVILHLHPQATDLRGHSTTSPEGWDRLTDEVKRDFEHVARQRGWTSGQHYQSGDPSQLFIILNPSKVAQKVAGDTLSEAPTDLPKAPRLSLRRALPLQAVKRPTSKYMRDVYIG